MVTATVDIAMILANSHQAFARKDMDAIVGCFDKDIRFVSPDGELHGRSARIVEEQRIFELLDNSHIEVTASVVDGDEAVEMCRMCGKIKAGLNAGTDVAFRYVVHYRFSGELITFQEVVFDRAAVAEKLGLA